MASSATSLLPEEVELMEDEKWLNTAPVSAIISKTDAINQETKFYINNTSHYKHEIATMKKDMQDNVQKINLNKELPYIVGNLAEILELPAEEPTEEEEKKPANHYTATVKCMQRSVYFLREIGFVDRQDLHPEYDTRVAAMEIDERPKEDFTQIGGLDKQIEEIIEAVVMPMEQADLFVRVGIKPPKGVLLYGPPGTGKTLMARAVASQCKSTFLKLAAPQLVQMYVGDGAKMVRDCFALAREKAPTIIFIDELDAIGAKRQSSETGHDHEVARTMLELLNQLDGFTQNEHIKVIGATNRVDVLDPALLRSGRIDRKIELPNPNLVARVQILKIHARRMNVNPDVNFDELARMTDDFNGAQLKAVCVEAGMLALRRGATELMHEDFVGGVAEVQAKKKTEFQYYV